MPLMKVIRLVDSNESPSMSFLYSELNEAMEKIKSNFSNIKQRLSGDREESLTTMDTLHHARGAQKKMNIIVYVMYNSKLLRRQSRDIERIFDEIDSCDEWLAGEDGEVENENAEELVGIDDETTFENESTHEQSFLDDEQRFEEEFVADEDEGGDRGNNEEDHGDENAYDEDEEDEEDE
ncbi:hypothetical protein LINPERPRIM_LOCUS30533 [Linum perenne]